MSVDGDYLPLSLLQGHAQAGVDKGVDGLAEAREILLFKQRYQVFRELRRYYQFPPRLDGVRRVTCSSTGNCVISRGDWLHLRFSSDVFPFAFRRRCILLWLMIPGLLVIQLVSKGVNPLWWKALVGS